MVIFGKLSEEALKVRLARHPDCRPHIAGQGFTWYECGVCKRTLMHSDTGIPVLCKECADNYVACRWCGQGIRGVPKNKAA